MADFVIPLQAQTAQNFNVKINGTVYNFNFWFNTATNGGWVLDIASADGTKSVSGIPLVTGADLLAQYEYLFFGFKLFIFTQGAPFQPPTWQTLGQTSQLIAEF